ncbi:MAG: hypothetical protein GF347_04125 [Candidatus Moranbacteria bacterium]|nr:hypothetical protein [Candidatus Moranbacteria bacterium]
MSKNKWKNYSDSIKLFFAGSILALIFEIYQKAINLFLENIVSFCFKHFNILFCTFFSLILIFSIYKLTVFYLNNLEAKVLKINFLDKTLIFILGFIIPFLYKKQFEIFNLFLEKNDIYNIFIGSILYFLIILILVRLYSLYKLEANARKNKSNNHPINDEPLKNLKDIKSIQNYSDKKVLEEYEINIKFLIKNINSTDNKTLNNGSFVYCIDASWGHGKTSFINIVKNKIFNQNNKKPRQKIQEILDFIKRKYPKDIIWIDYNPWHFSSQSELIEDFFQTIENKINKKYGRGLGGNLKKYVELVTPVIESNNSTKILSGILKFFSSKKDLTQIKEEIKESLTSIKEKIIIVLDDIDRLKPKDLFLIIKLVKLVSDFPNIIFILPMDYSRVSKIIKAEYNDQYDNYLQKIVNHRIKLKPYTYDEFLAMLNWFMNRDNMNKEKKPEKQKIPLENIKKVFEYYILKAKQQVIQNEYNDKSVSSNNDDKDKVEQINFIKKFFREFHVAIFTEDKRNKIYDDSMIESLEKDITSILDQLYYNHFKSMRCFQKNIVKVSRDAYRKYPSTNKRPLPKVKDEEAKIKNKFVEYLITPRDLKQLATKLKGVSSKNIVNQKGELKEKVKDRIDELVETQTFF